MFAVDVEWAIGEIARLYYEIRIEGRARLIFPQLIGEKLKRLRRLLRISTTEVLVADVNDSDHAASPSQYCWKANLIESTSPDIRSLMPLPSYCGNACFSHSLNSGSVLPSEFRSI